MHQEVIENLESIHGALLRMNRSIQRIKIYSVTGIMNRTEYSRQKYHELLLNEHGGNADTDIHGV